MHSDGYWISPAGEFILLEKKHIDYIAEHPEKFNTTRKEIDAIYEKHNEKKLMEGYAREEIMINAMQNGWIRVRNDIKKGWIIQTYYLNSKDKENICCFVKYLVSKKPNERYSDILITSIQNRCAIQSNPEKIINDGL